MTTAALNPPPLLEVNDLYAGFPTLTGISLAANGVSFSVRPGEVLGLVGESGSGKSITCRALIGLIPPPGELISGEIRFDGRDLLESRAEELRRVRAREIGMVFQDPTSVLNPVFKVGDQVSEVLRVNLGMRGHEAERHAIELLEHVGIPSPESRYHAYPHELSGGMRQRVMIAIAIAPRPRLLLADEPTTALDVTIQAQILALLRNLQAETGMAMILVSHDLGVVAQHCDTVAVMYAGFIVERGPVEAIFEAPLHPYTRALVGSLLPLEPAVARRRLTPISGQPPDLGRLPMGCPFAPRCAWATDGCSDVAMTLAPTPDGRATACPYVGSSPSPTLDPPASSLESDT